MNDAIGEKISGVFKEYVVDPLKKDNENLSNVLGDIKKDFEEKINGISTTLEDKFGDLNSNNDDLCERISELTKSTETVANKIVSSTKEIKTHINGAAKALDEKCIKAVSDSEKEKRALMDSVKNELIERAGKTDAAVQRLSERANDAFSDCKNIVDNAVNDIKTCTAEFLDSAETRIVELICTEAGRTNAETAKKLDEQNERITKLAMQNDALKKLLTVVLAVGGACAIMLAVTIIFLLI